ncbi:MAG TPA: hypothetical protein DC054_10425 [Blastocatellia bacterium]|jgi:hypothetical protein|nr:hypothetical protein [Blastocatellia bacterium]
MAKTIWISIRCLNCREWLASQIFFSDSESFDTSVLFDYLASCPHCGKLTRSNKENFRAKFEDGVILGDEA